MKRYFLVLLSLVIMGSLTAGERALSPYFSLGTLSGSIDSEAGKVQLAMESQGFVLIGSYHPEGKSTFMVQAFSHPSLTKVLAQLDEEMALAGVLKVALMQDGSNVKLSMINPEYIFRAYLRAEFAANSTALLQIDSKMKNALSTFGNPVPFGGTLDESDLKKYHYMMGMPYFDDMVELNTFSSYAEGRKIILDNLKQKKGNTALVYEYRIPGKDISVFGVALLDDEDGEGHFLPIIGEDHIAAMPYEFILVGDEAKMLHGRFRFALHWPELTMGTFTKIMSSPGDVEDFMEALTE